MPSTWSRTSLIFVIFSLCLFVLVSSRPAAEYPQYDEGILNIQRLHNVPFGAHFSPNRIYYQKKKSDPWGAMLHDNFAPAGGDDILGLMNYKGLRG